MIGILYLTKISSITCSKKALATKLDLQQQAISYNVPLMGSLTISVLSQQPVKQVHCSSPNTLLER